MHLLLITSALATAIALLGAWDLHRTQRSGSEHSMSGAAVMALVVGGLIVSLVVGAMIGDLLPLGADPSPEGTSPLND